MSRTKQQARSGAEISETEKAAFDLFIRNFTKTVANNPDGAQQYLIVLQALLPEATLKAAINTLKQDTSIASRYNFDPYPEVPHATIERNADLLLQMLGEMTAHSEEH